MNPPDPDCPACANKLSTPEERLPTCSFIAEGHCAQGAAGCMGGGPEYLLVLRHGQAVEIVRSGRLYGTPKAIRLECESGNVVATFPRQDAEERRAARKWASIAAESGGE